MDYDGTNLEVRTNQTGIRPAAADLSRALDIPDILNQSTSYVGLTSGTGADWGNHGLLSEAAPERERLLQLEHVIAGARELVRHRLDGYGAVALAFFL